jgi:hypothetical protein
LTIVFVDICIPKKAPYNRAKERYLNIVYYRIMIISLTLAD